MWSPELGIVKDRPNPYAVYLFYQTNIFSHRRAHFRVFLYLSTQLINAWCIKSIAYTESRKPLECANLSLTDTHDWSQKHTRNTLERDNSKWSADHLPALGCKARRMIQRLSCRSRRCPWCSRWDLPCLSAPPCRPAAETSRGWGPDQRTEVCMG